MSVTINGTTGITAPAATLATPLGQASGGTNAASIPAFSVSRLTDQSISSAVFTKVQVNNKTIDTANAFDATTNFRFQPSVAGTYLISFACEVSAVSGLTRTLAAVYKTGSVACFGSDGAPPTVTQGISTGSFITTLNGTTDYLELYAYAVGTTLNVKADFGTFISGVLVRAA